MGRTKIEWADYTFNPWRGCSHISAGCDNCCAERQAKRRPDLLGEWGPNAKRVIAAEPYWRLPIRWNRAAEKTGQRRRVFVGSMMDVFEDRPELIKPRGRLFDLIWGCSWLTWLLLTKRPALAFRLVHRTHCESRPDFAVHFPHVWLGVSIENQKKANDRTQAMRRMPAGKRFLSLEPLLGPIDQLPLDGIDWVIIGGESGPGARPCDLGWIRSILRRCREAGVAVFCKQTGSVWARENQATDVKGGRIGEWPRDIQVREFPES